MCSSAAAVVSAEFCGGAAPLTVKFEPGSDWNTAPSDGFETQSWAQAKRPRRMTGMSYHIVRLSKRAPSSLRVSVALIAL